MMYSEIQKLLAKLGDRVLDKQIHADEDEYVLWVQIFNDDRFADTVRTFRHYDDFLDYLNPARVTTLPKVD